VSEDSKKIVERVAETTRIPKEQLSEKPPFPNKMKIELTARCDLKCYFCSLTYKPRDKGDIKKEQIERVIDEAKELGVRDLGMFWLGESVLVPELPDYVAYAKKVGIEYVFITTNGRMANKARMSRLIDSGVDSIKFSFNAPTRETYKEVTGVDAFDQVVEHIRSTSAVRGDRKKPKLYASTTYHPDRPQDFQISRALVEPYVDQHYPLPLYGVQRSDERDARKLSDMLPCWSLFTEPHISFEGNMSACFCDHDPRLFMGNVFESGLLGAWHSEKFVELRRKHLAGDAKDSPCSTCIAYSHD
jgi:pyruvate-formate lyase-activating enzyme